MDKITTLMYGLDDELIGNTQFIELVHKILGMISDFSELCSEEVIKLEKQYDENFMNRTSNVVYLRSNKIHTAISSMMDAIKNLKMLMKNDKSIEKYDKDLVFEELKQKIYIVLDKYINLEERHKDKLKNILKFEIKLVDPNIADDQLDSKINKFIESGDYDVFAIHDEHSKRYKEADEMYNYVKNRHKQILTIQKNMDEIYAMYSLFAVLIDKQNETINTIQQNTETAKVNVILGTRVLADKKPIKNKKCVMC